MSPDYHSQFVHLFIQKAFLECQETLGMQPPSWNVCVWGGREERMRERELIFGGTDLGVVVFREREVWLGVQIDLGSNPNSSPYQLCVTLGILDTFFIPNFLPSKMGTIFSRVVRRIKMKG